MKFLRVPLCISFSAVLLGSSCQPDAALLLPERRQAVSQDGDLELLARFVHVTDTHVVDEESPARFAAAHEVTSSAWRSWESSSTQILDGVIRTVNRIHASGRPIDFLVHSGDACDNAQHNELGWLVRLLEGGQVDPRSGPDDRPLKSRPDPLMDPHAAFEAQGLYQNGIHGAAASIPWYILAGNHDVFSMGVFPIFTLWDGRRVAYLPLQPRPGVFLPSAMEPTAAFAYGRITPAEPGPPELFTWPVPIAPVADRAYFSLDEFTATMRAGTTSPVGHGFGDDGLPWYSVSPAAGLRLIGLYSSDLFEPPPGQPSWQGSILADQVEWLRGELEAATARGERVIVATHHPSSSLEVLYGSALDPEGFRNLLNAYPAVVLHIAGHEHRNRVADRGGYLEIETCSTLDWPQEGRLIELWRGQDGSIFVGYEMFSHVQEDLPPLGDDPLFELRRQARAAAAGTAQSPESRGLDNAGDVVDRTGWVRLPGRP